MCSGPKVPLLALLPGRIGHTNLGFFRRPFKFHVGSLYRRLTSLEPHSQPGPEQMKGDRIDVVWENDTDGRYEVFLRLARSQCQKTWGCARNAPHGCKVSQWDKGFRHHLIEGLSNDFSQIQQLCFFSR